MAKIEVRLEPGLGSEIQRYREKELQFRTLAKGYARARQFRVAAKLEEVASEFAARVDVLEHKARSKQREDFRPDVGMRLRELLRLALIGTGADRGNIQLLRRDTHVLRIAASEGFEAPFLDFFRMVDAAEDSACGAALRRRMPVIVPDVANSPIFAGKRSGDVMLAAGSRSVQSCPLIDRSGALLGMISTHRAATWHPDDGELRRLAEIGRLIATEMAAHF